MQSSIAGSGSSDAVLVGNPACQLGDVLYALPCLDNVWLRHEAFDGAAIFQQYRSNRQRRRHLRGIGKASRSRCHIPVAQAVLTTGRLSG